MKIGLLQPNPVVGDLEGNASRIEAMWRKAADGGADLCVAPELAMLGYPPRDLLLYDAVLDKTREHIEQLAGRLKGGPPLLVGGVERNNSEQGKPAVNAAFLLRGGVVEAVFSKTLLPSYDVFDEARYFEPADASHDPAIFDLDGRKIGVTICEDAWNDKDFWPVRAYGIDPVERLAQAGADILVNLSASPFSVGKQDVRQDMLGAVAARHGLPIAYVNQVGGNDDLVFDGRSMILSANGALAAQAHAFQEDVLVADLESQAAVLTQIDEQSDILNALVLGTRDYLHKSGFSKAVLGLSGGVDSAVTASLAVQALGPNNVMGVLMPSPYSSQGSVDDSLALAQNLGIATHTLPIEPVMQAMNAALAEPFSGREPDVTEENIQARIRGNLLMAMSNKFGAMLLTTGNKSELAVGYCTIYGDMAGGFAPISDVPKVGVYRLAAWMNDNLNEIIPQSILDKPPSAELRPDQTDQDSLPPYEILDAILELHVEQHLGGDEIAAKGYNAEVVQKIVGLVKGAEFKRRQAVPGIKIRPRSFGSGWRMPLACKRML